MPLSKQYYCQDCACCGHHVPGAPYELVGSQPDGLCKPKQHPHPLMHDYADVAKASAVYTAALVLFVFLPVRLLMYAKFARERD